MNNIEKICEILRKRGPAFRGTFYIPEKWNFFGYEGGTASLERPGELAVNPYDFFARSLEENFLARRPCPRREGPLTQNVVYAMVPRFYSAWPHGADGEVNSGTFLKCMALLPLVKQLGANMVYLLPVFEHSRRYRKGELGSFYSIRDIYRLDEGLHDPLLGGTDIRLEFRAFMEACHRLGMRVMLDFAFRTVARDSELLFDHPDWFYWIRTDREAEFRPPVVGTRKKITGLDDETRAQLYREALRTGYFDFFTASPDRGDPVRWEKIREEHRQGKDMFPAIVEEFGITTVPGFSDVVNDRQPPWTDVTYLRFYSDDCAHPPAAMKPGQAPYILQDGASLDSRHGKVKNRELWEYVAGVIPFYEREYGIDGARIDMAHALPKELCDEVVARARGVNPQFILWSEEFDPHKGAQAAGSGFNFISGFTYLDYKKYRSPEFNRQMPQNTLLQSALPVTSALETPDTPRAALVYRSPRARNMLAVLSCFMPNSIPLIDNGQELAEIQPMNLGLDNTEEGRYVLPKSDPMYGKLAFFDTCCLHWLQDDGGIGGVLRDVLRLRKRFGGIVGDPARFVSKPAPADGCLTLLRYRAGETYVFCAANRSQTDEISVTQSDLLAGEELRRGAEGTILYRGGLCSRRWEADRPLVLRAEEAVVGTIGRPGEMRTFGDETEGEKRA